MGKKIQCESDVRKHLVDFGDDFLGTIICKNDNTFWKDVMKA